MSPGGWSCFSFHVGWLPRAVSGEVSLSLSPKLPTVYEHEAAWFSQGVPSPREFWWVLPGSHSRKVISVSDAKTQASLRFLSQVTSLELNAYQLRDHELADQSRSLGRVEADVDGYTAKPYAMTTHCGFTLGSNPCSLASREEHFQMFSCFVFEPPLYVDNRLLRSYACYAICFRRSPLLPTVHSEHRDFVLSPMRSREFWKTCPQRLLDEQLTLSEGKHCMSPGAIMVKSGAENTDVPAGAVVTIGGLDFCLRRSQIPGEVASTPAVFAKTGLQVPSHLPFHGRGHDLLPSSPQTVSSQEIWIEILTSEADQEVLWAGQCFLDPRRVSGHQFQVTSGLADTAAIYGTCEIDVGNGVIVPLPLLQSTPNTRTFSLPAPIAPVKVSGTDDL
ncbi:hypothetical protein CB1_000726044 [Camelus ferus]|nr:hypothetical protein CB1_000726044 [Camelus ferus]